MQGMIGQSRIGWDNVGQDRVDYVGIGQYWTVQDNIGQAEVKWDMI